MLRQCRDNGCETKFFIGSNCPICNQEGKFIMSDREAQSLGRILALVLRHAPEKFGVDMDINGWVNTRELSDAISNQRRHYHWLRGWHFEAIANSDEKGLELLTVIQLNWSWTFLLTIYQKHFTGHVSQTKCRQLWNLELLQETDNMFTYLNR